MGYSAKKVLIVDSDKAFREPVATFIKTLGHRVFEATSGPEAIDKLTNILPDLLIIDLRLPGLNGDGVTARVKANRLPSNIPVLINTGWTTPCTVEERINRALIAGAAEILYRPVQFPTLRRVLRNNFFPSRLRK